MVLFSVVCVGIDSCGGKCVKTETGPLAEGFCGRKYMKPVGFIQVAKENKPLTTIQTYPLKIISFF